HPPVTLVGKGVCFDTGGLNVKSMAGMRHMKRDMGGAAVMLGLGALIMSERLPIRLRILLPIVENAIAGNAMRPGDLIPTRDGATIEVENTDCEGRIILADALTYAIEEDPELVIDCATLTGSARTAFGGEIQALFASNDALGQALQEAGAKTDDALWQMPIWAGYRSRVSAPTGDLLNMAPGGYAGAITAALFLQHFARDAQNWAHLDISAWNDSARPGRPVGGEATGLSAIYDYLKGRFGQ
ncbi:MAG: leucyl aminopeptidase family protein, partial [Alphaproteobacteria bacterium]